MILTAYVDDLLLLGADKLLLNKLKKQLMDRSEMTTDMGDVSRVLSMSVTRDLEKETIIINQRGYTKDVVERFGMKICSLVYTPGVGPELSLNQLKENCSTRKARSVTNPSRVLSCTLDRFLAATSTLPLTSWRGQCPSLESLSGSDRD